MIGGVTRLGGLPGLPGRVTLSAGVTICHVNVSRWGNPPSRGCIHSKKLESEHLKLCTYPSCLTAEIARNHNGHTRSVKCSHFRIFSIVNRPYLVSQSILYNVLSVNGSSRNQTPQWVTLSWINTLFKMWAWDASAQTP